MRRVQITLDTFAGMRNLVGAYRGSDEFCNPSLLVRVWPLTLIVFYGKGWRTRPCDACRADARAEGLCEQCLSRPCVQALL